MNFLKDITCHCSFLSGAGSGIVDEVQPSYSSVKETSRILATAVCCHDVLKTFPPSVRGSGGPNALHVRTMLRLVKELLSKHQIVFDKSVKSIAESSKRMDEGLDRVVTDMFKDGQVNWGRVVAVYAFAQRLAQYSVQHNMPNMTEKIADVTAKFIEDKLTEWILNQGGWDSFEKQFQEEETTESKMWTGLLCTFIGLGTLATITALK